MNAFSQLDSRQTRRLLLAGTTALPKPFPCSAIVWLEEGGLTFACGEKPVKEWFIAIRERGDLHQATTRHVRASDVVALYFPDGVPEAGKKDAAKPPRNTDEACGCGIDDLDSGLWVMSAEINKRDLKSRMGVDLTSPQTCVKAIAFVPKHAPVYTVKELGQTAASVPEPKPVKHAYCSSCN